MMYNTEFAESSSSPSDVEFSVEDKKFLEKMNEEVKIVDDHYQVPITFRDSVKLIDSLPSNKGMVKKRMLGLKKRFISNPKTLSDYKTFMKNLLEKGVAQKASPEEGKSWFTPHFGVHHPAKPEKIQLVFNYSASFYGTTLNKHIMQSLDLTSNLLGY